MTVWLQQHGPVILRSFHRWEREWEVFAALRNQSYAFPSSLRSNQLRPSPKSNWERVRSDLRRRTNCSNHPIPSLWLQAYATKLGDRSGSCIKSNKPEQSSMSVDICGIVHAIFHIAFEISSILDLLKQADCTLMLQLRCLLKCLILSVGLVWCGDLISMHCFKLFHFWREFRRGLLLCQLVLTEYRLRPYMGIWTIKILSVSGLSRSIYVADRI